RCGYIFLATTVAFLNAFKDTTVFIRLNKSGEIAMIILLLALIGALIVMAILSIGRLAFGRRELFIARKFVRWFTGYFIFNYSFCLLILYVSHPALTVPFGGWQWILFQLVVRS